MSAADRRPLVWADVPHCPARFLPRAGRDLLWQILLFCGAYWLYRLVRGRSTARPRRRSTNARDIVDARARARVFVEPADAGVGGGTRAGSIDVGSWMYVNTHFVVTTCTLAFIYLFRNEHFYFVRNMFMVAMGLALVGYVVYPDRAAADACPSRVHGLGGGLHRADVASRRVNALYNPFAAVPSMHVAFALMLGVPMAAMARRPLGEGRSG